MTGVANVLFATLLETIIKCVFVGFGFDQKCVNELAQDLWLLEQLAGPCIIF
jgi:hypothetical protein